MFIESNAPIHYMWNLHLTQLEFIWNNTMYG